MTFVTKGRDPSNEGTRRQTTCQSSIRVRWPSHSSLTVIDFCGSGLRRMPRGTSIGVEAEKYKRPGIELITAAGRRWEADKYQDLIDTSPKDAIEYVEKPEVDELVGRKTFDKVRNLFDILRRDHPPFAVIEAEFDVPSSITPGLQRAYDSYGLEPVRAGRISSGLDPMAPVPR